VNYLHVAVSVSVNCNRSDNREIPSTYGIHKFIIILSKARHLCPVLSRRNPNRTVTLNFFKIILMLYPYRILELLSGFFPSGFQPKVCISVAFVRATSRTHLIFLH